MQTYYTPDDAALDLSAEGSYTPPGADSTAFELPYRTPLPNALSLDNPSGYAAPPAYIVAFPADNQTPSHDQLNLDCPAGYAAPAADACDFGFPVQPPESIGLSISATAPASTAQISLSVINPGFTLAIDAAGPAAAVNLQVDQIAPASTLSLNVTGPQSSTQIHIDAEVPVYPVSINASGPAASISLQVEWGQRVPGASLTSDGRGTRMGWNDAPSKPRELIGRHQNAERVDSATASAWDAVPEQDRQTDAAHNQMTALDGADQLTWGSFGTADQDSQQTYTQPPALDRQQAQAWDAFEQTPAAEPEHSYIYPPAKDSNQTEAWFSTELIQPRTLWVPAPPKEWPSLQPGTYTPPAAVAVDLDSPAVYDQPTPSSYEVWTDHGKWQRWHYRNINFGDLTEEDIAAPVPWPPKPVEANRPSDSSWTAPVDQMQHHDQSNRVPWGAGSWSRPYPDYGNDIPWPNEPDEPAPRPPQPEIHEVYLFMPNITLYRLPDGAEFEATSVTLSSDRDSWGWTINANLKRDTDLAIIKPISNGPVEIGCQINGHDFTFLLESYGRNRQIGNSSYTITGRSRTAWLTEPYAPKRSKALTSAYSAAALAEQELANTGFTLQWIATDWLIPAGAYSYESLTPIGAIKRIAEAAGYMLQSHPELQQLIVSPRYRVDPHRWTDPATALDAILPADLITQEGGNFRTKPNYNRAIVTGGPEGGVIVTVTRDGTAGDILAPMITDDLITHSDAGYQRGRALIAEGGAWEEMSITTMLTPATEAPGLILPGHLVEIQDTDDTYPVIIDGASITAQMGEKEIKVRQQLTVERRMAQ